MKVSKKLFLLLACLVLMFSFSPGREAQAQETGTWLYFSPDPSYIYIDGTNQVTVDIMVRDAVNINAFDIKIEFDPSVVSYVGYEIGGFLKEVFCFPPYTGSDYIQLVCTQLAQPGKDGSGSLLRFTFNGIVEGSTFLDFGKAVLNHPNGDKVFPGTTDGTLYVVNPANFNYLPMVLNVSLQGVVDRGGIQVALARGTNKGMGPYSGTSLNQGGNNLTIANVVADSYRISTNHPRVLNISPEMNKIFTLATGANQVPPLKLVAGNAAWADNEININDWAAVNGAWGDVSLNPDADVNFDGFVDALDLALVAGNFGLNSEVAYAAWLP